MFGARLRQVVSEGIVPSRVLPSAPLPNTIVHPALMLLALLRYRVRPRAVNFPVNLSVNLSVSLFLGVNHTKSIGFWKVLIRRGGTSHRIKFFIWFEFEHALQPKRGGGGGFGGSLPHLRASFTNIT